MNGCGFGGCWWIIILILIISCCCGNGCGNTFSDNGCGCNNCGLGLCHTVAEDQPMLALACCTKSSAAV